MIYKPRLTQAELEVFLALRQKMKVWWAEACGLRGVPEGTPVQLFEEHGEVFLASKEETIDADASKDGNSPKS